MRNVRTKLYTDSLTNLQVLMAHSQKISQSYIIR